MRIIDSSANAVQIRTKQPWCSIDGSKVFILERAVKLNEEGSVESDWHCSSPSGTACTPVRTEPLPQATAIEQLLKFGYVVREIFGRTNRQADTRAE